MVATRTLLATRLAELEAAGVVRHEPGAGGRAGAYRLTPSREALRPVVEVLGDWGQRYAPGGADADELDPSLLMWDLRRKIEVRVAPPRRVVIRFDFRGVPGRDRRRARWWVVVTPAEVDLCLKDPGYPEDLTVSADLEAFTLVWLGRLGFREALRAGTVEVEGLRPLVQAFPTWLPVPAATPAELPRYAIAAAR